MKTLKLLTLAAAIIALVFTSCRKPKEEVKATGIELPATAEVSNVAPVELMAVVTPADATGTVNWVSSNPEIVTVVASGERTAIVTYVSAGEATITATIDDITSLPCVVTSVFEATYPQVEPVAGSLVWVVKFDVAPCNDVVFAGSPVWGWNTSLPERKFVPIEDWAGWYKLVLPITEADADGEWLISGKPGQLANDSTWPTNWDFQVGWSSEADAVVLAGANGIVIEAGYGGECNIHFSSIDETIVTRFVKWKAVPCAPKHNYIFNVTVPAATPEDAVVRIVGSFGVSGLPDWAADGAGMEMTKVDATHYTLNLNNVAEGTFYKYVINGSWDYEELAAIAEGADCANAIDNRTTPTTETVTDVVANWRNVTAPRCAK